MEWLEARQQPFPDGWRSILEREIGFYLQLDAEARARFEEQVKVFVLTKEFAGADGFVVDDTVKVVVAATACRLTVNLAGEYYGRLRFITVRPRSFRHRRTLVLGTAHQNKVVLSWEALQHGLRAPSDGDNVGYHEFAHVLDGADGTMDGMPLFCDPSLYGRWAEVLEEEFRLAREAKRQRIASLLGEDAASSEAELFAVAAETFFQRPLAMRALHPQLYELLADYFQQQPHTTSQELPCAGGERILRERGEPPETVSGLVPVALGGATSPSATAPGSAARPVPVAADEPLPVEVQRRAHALAAQCMETPPRAVDPEAAVARRARLRGLKDPYRWGARNVVRLLGGLAVAMAVVIFLMPSAGDIAHVSLGHWEWSRVQASRVLGRTGPVLLALGVVLLVIGSLIDRDE
jgi:Mlc titration factor MtfA (ptsG expression regulator)